MPETNQKMVELLTRKEVASNFKITDRTLRRWEKNGKIHAYRLTSRVVRYSQEEVARVLQNGMA